MTKREKILLGVAALSCVCVLSALLISPSAPPPQGPEEQLAQTRQFVDGLTGELAKSVDANATGRLLAMVEAPWNNDPFLSPERLLTIREQEVQDPSPGADQTDFPELRYEGFIMAGDKIVAIINGIEYGVRDSLADPRFTVRSISPSEVAVATGGNLEMILPLSEEH